MTNIINKNIYVKSYGCQMNMYDSNRIKDLFEPKGYSQTNQIENADLIVLLTEWDEFKTIDFKKIVKNKKFKVYDLRNLYSPIEMRKNKIKYYSVGRPNIN